MRNIKSENKTDKAKKKEKSGGLWLSFWVKLIGILIILSCIMVFGFVFYKRVLRQKIERTHQAVTNQVLHVAELTTLKNNYSDIISIKKSGVGGLAKAYVIIKYSGVIRVGVQDLTRAKISVNDKGTEVRIKIPRCTILDNTLVSQAVFDEKRSVFVPITLKEIFAEIETAMADFALSAERRGLIEEADAHLVEIVSATVKGFGYDRVTVELMED